MMAVVMAICTAFWSYDVHIAVIYVTSGAMGLFFGIGFTMITVVVQVNAQLKDLGPATAVAQFIRSLGSTVSIAVFAAILNTAMPTIFASYLPSLGKLGISPSAAKAYVDSVTSGAPMPNLNAQQLAAISEATARSFAQALRWCFLAILPACLLAFIFLMFVPVSFPGNQIC